MVEVSGGHFARVCTLPAKVHPWGVSQESTRGTIILYAALKYTNKYMSKVRTTYNAFSRPLLALRLANQSW